MRRGRTATEEVLGPCLAGGGLVVFHFTALEVGNHSGVQMEEGDWVGCPPLTGAEPARAHELRLGTHTSCFTLLKPEVEGRAGRARWPGSWGQCVRVPSLQRRVLEWAGPAFQGSGLWMWSV